MVRVPACLLCVLLSLRMSSATVFVCNIKTTQKPALMLTLMCIGTNGKDLISLALRIRRLAFY